MMIYHVGIGHNFQNTPILDASQTLGPPSGTHHQVGNKGLDYYDSLINLQEDVRGL